MQGPSWSWSPFGLGLQWLQATDDNSSKGCWLRGVAWLTLGDGPGLAAGQAWCSEFGEVSAGVRNAHVQAHGLVLPPTVMEVHDLVEEQTGGRQLPAAASPARLVGS